MNKTSSYFIPINDLLVKDSPVPIAKSTTEPEILERYWNDIYKLFINRLSQFDASTKATDEDKGKLKALLNELIYVKTLLADN